MRSHPWKFELSRGRVEVQITLLVKELPVTMPSPQEAIWRSSKRNTYMNFLWNHSYGLWMCTASPWSSVSCHLHFCWSGFASILLTRRPEADIHNRLKLSSCSHSYWTLLSVALQFSYLDVTFLNAFGEYFLALFSPTPSYIAPLSDL